MSESSHPIGFPLSVAQRAFVDAAEQRGATAAAGAVALTDLPRLSARELDALVEAGLVREAADWRYYVYRARGHAGISAPVPDARSSLRPTVTGSARFVRSLVFWLVLLLIPILYIQFAAGR